MSRAVRDPRCPRSERHTGNTVSSIIQSRRLGVQEWAGLVLTEVVNDVPVCFQKSHDIY